MSIFTRAVDMTDEDWAAAGVRVGVYDDRPTDGDPDFVAIARFAPPRACQIRPGSVGWDEQLLGRLRVEVAGEQGLTQRGVLNVLLGDWLALTPEDRCDVKQRGLAWERAQRP